MKKIFLALLLPFLLSIPTNSEAVQVGYEARACSFDMDDDGRLGENGTQKFCQAGVNDDERCSVDSDCPGSTCANTGSTTNDDCNVCDGVTTNVDGVAGDENLIYVDCNSGNDANAGTAGSQFRTLGRAFTEVDTDDGDSIQDIVCFRATCSLQNASGVNDLAHNVQGVAGTYTRTKRGDDAYGYSYATKPVMIIGWDQNNDGSYPPFDTEAEPPIVDGCSQNGGCAAGTGSGTTYLIAFDSGGSDRIEFAHFKVQNYGLGCGTGIKCGAFHADVGDATYNYLHDLDLNYINYSVIDGADTSGQGVFRYFSAVSTNLAIENNWIHNHDTYPLRSPGAGVSERLRFKNNTISNPQPGSSSGPTRFWSREYAEITNNKWDFSMVAAGDVALTDNALSITESNAYIYVTGNEWIDVPRAITTGYMIDSGSAERTEPSTGLYIRRNKFIYTRDINSAVRVVAVAPSATDGIERNECTASCTPTSTCFSASGFSSNSNCSCLDGGDGHGGWSNVFVEGNVWDFRNHTDATETLYSAFEYQNGNNCGASNDIFGPLYFQNNTILGFNPGRIWNPTCLEGCTRGMLMLGLVNNGSRDFRNTDGDVYVRNNIFTGLNNDYVLINRKTGDDGFGPISGSAYFDPGVDLYMDYNIYNGSNIYFWSEGASVSGVTSAQALTAFKNQSGEEDNGKTCTPTFDTDGVHLVTADTCAEDSGGTTVCAGSCAGNADCLATDPDHDIDYQTRPQNTTCDIGADEFESGSPGTLQLASSSYELTETNGLVTISVTRTGGSSGAPSVSYAVTSSTASSGTACTTGVDFISPINASCTASTVPYACCTGSGTGTCGTLSWSNADAATKTFTVQICDDSTIESSEVATITLSNPTISNLGSPSWASLIINDNDVPSGATPVVDLTNPPKSACESTDDNSLTIPSVAVAGGVNRQNRILVVVIGGEGAYNSGDPVCDLQDTTVTWNSQNLVRAGSVKGIAGTTVGVCSGVFYLLNPAATTSTVSITFGGTVTDKQATAFTIYNAEQQTPLVSAFSTTSTGQDASPVSHNIQVTLPDTLLVDVLALGERVGAGNMVAGGGQTERADVACDPLGSHTGSSTKEVLNPAATAMSWSWTLQSGEPGARRYAHVITGFSSTPTAPTTTVTTTTSGGTTTTIVTTTTVSPSAPTIGYGCIYYCEEN